MSYWVYQHLGNLSPAELATDPLYAAVRETPTAPVSSGSSPAGPTPTRPRCAGATGATSAAYAC